MNNREQRQKQTDNAIATLLSPYRKKELDDFLKKQRRTKEQTLLNIPEEVVDSIIDELYELSIINYEVCMIVDLIDGGDDYYYVVKKVDGETIHVSCTCSHIPLKGKLKKKDYDHERRIWLVNHLLRQK